MHRGIDARHILADDVVGGGIDEEIELAFVLQVQPRSEIAVLEVAYDESGGRRDDHGNEKERQQKLDRERGRKQLGGRLKTKRQHRPAHDAGFWKNNGFSLIDSRMIA